MRIHHLNCATMCPPLGRLIGGADARGAGHLVCHCLLVETNDGLVLVDTGLGTADVANARATLGAGFVRVARPVLDREETALAQVERLGFQREDVRHLVPTHLDLDHAGGLPDFPDATVHVYGKERDAALRPPSFREKERYRPAHFAHEPKWNVLETAGEKWFGFDSVRALGGTDEEVLLVPLIGHTRGHCGIAVRTGDGWLLHAGDAYFFHAEMRDPPECPIGLRAFQSLVEVMHAPRVENQRRLRALAKEHAGEVRIFSAHCPKDLDRERAATDPRAKA